MGIRGPLSDLVVDTHFRPISGELFSEVQDRNIVYGVWQPTGEDLVVTRDGINQVEIHCHGGTTACSAILKSLANANVTPVAPSEFALASQNAWKVSTQTALSQAATSRTSKILLHQSRLLPSAIDQIDSLVKSGQSKSAIAMIEPMLSWSQFGIHLTQPRSIVLCGQPNVGKSSLANAVIGFQRAIVHQSAGTTRDVVSQLTAIDGWPVVLKDTAGIRQAHNLIEAIGIEKAKVEIDAADLRICIFVANRTWNQADQQLLESVNPQLIVFNKIDLAEQPPGRLSIDASLPDRINTSAVTGQGIRTLINKISDRLVSKLPDPQQPIPVSESQQRKLEQVLCWLRESTEDNCPDIYDLLLDSK